MGWWQTGQRFTRGASRRCCDRRLSRRAFDVFCFGTAIDRRSIAVGFAAEAARRDDLQAILELGEGPPAGIDVQRCVLVRLDVEIDSADGAQAGAVDAAEDLVG